MTSIRTDTNLVEVIHIHEKPDRATPTNPTSETSGSGKHGGLIEVDVRGPSE